MLLDLKILPILIILLGPHIWCFVCIFFSIFVFCIKELIFFFPWFFFFLDIVWCDILRVICDFNC